MNDYRNKYIKMYFKIILGVIFIFGILNYFSKGSIDKIVFIDMFIAIGICVYINYVGKTIEIEIDKGMFKSFCVFESNYDKDNVDVFYTYITSIPTFIYILLIFSYRDKLPRVFLTITTLIIVLYTSSFIGYKICYFNKKDKSYLKRG